MKTRLILLIEKTFILLFLLLSITKISFSQSDDSLNTLQDTSSSIIDTSDYFPGDIGFNLIIAAEKGYESEILSLLNKGADINIRTKEGVTPLMYAAQNGHLNAIKILLLNGANPDLMPYKGSPALIVAASNGSPEILELLIRKGADINIQDNDARTALMYATAYGDLQISDLLLYYEANVNLADNSGITALMIACYFGYIDIAKLLIENKATLEKTDNNGFIAIHFATQNNNTEIIKLLISQGVDIEIKNNAGYAPLSIAVIKNYKDLCGYLIQNGADVNSKISNAFKPLNLAKKNKNDTIIHLLEENNASLSYFPSIDYGSINFDFSASPNDFLMGGGFGLHDSRYRVSMNLGFVTRILATEVLEGANDDTYYQYWEKRSYLYFSLTERIPIYSWQKDHYLGFGLGAQLIYTFGSFRGSNEKPDNRFLLSPQALVYARLKNFVFSFKYEYVNFKVEGLSPHRFIIGLHFLIPGKRIREPIHKEILY